MDSPQDAPMDSPQDRYLWVVDQPCSDTDMVVVCCACVGGSNCVHSLSTLLGTSLVHLVDVQSETLDHVLLYSAVLVIL